jgi:hypothetical protein
MKQQYEIGQIVYILGVTKATGNVSGLKRKRDYDPYIGMPVTVRAFNGSCYFFAENISEYGLWTEEISEFPLEEKTYEDCL